MCHDGADQTFDVVFLNKSERDIWHMTHWAPNPGSEMMQKDDFSVEQREDCGVACELEGGDTL
uniref:Uncharacterized protein n=1 Tax=Romanomermis culicivorax TaxID=13658 RepID=A0A915L1G0_ROMCU